ncbi:hypothetical protein [Lacticaseibacillus suihuaensis]
MMKTKLATMLATGALALTAAPLSAVGALQGNGVKQIDVRGTLTATAPGHLDMSFDVGATATGSVTRTWDPLAQRYEANFEASQKLYVLTNFNQPVTTVTARVNRMTTPWKENFAMYVGEGETDAAETAITVSKPGRSNWSTSYNFNFKSEKMPFRSGNAAYIIAGNYRATVDYHITVENDES